MIRPIATVNHGARTILGTDWPVISMVTRSRWGWDLAVRVCNGVPERGETYRTRKRALAALAAL